MLAPGGFNFIKLMLKKYFTAFVSPVSSERNLPLFPWPSPLPVSAPSLQPVNDISFPASRVLSSLILGLAVSFYALLNIWVDLHLWSYSLRVNSVHFGVKPDRFS